MDENLSKPSVDNSETPENEMKEASTDTFDKRREERVKRMRGWLGVKSSSPSYGHGDDGGPVSYGDAPNGWNR